MRTIRSVFRILTRGALPMMALLIFNTMFKIGVVMGGSMEPAYHNRQIVLVDRRYYRHHPICPGDVVLFRDNEGEMCVKRVFAISGQIVPEFFHKNDGSRLDTDGLVLIRLMESHMVRRHDLVVPPDYIYVVGDNPLLSEDSRAYGPIPVSSVWGKVLN